MQTVYKVADKHGRLVDLDSSVETTLKNWDDNLHGYAHIDICHSKDGSQYVKMDGALDCIRPMVMTADDDPTCSLLPGGAYLFSSYNSLNRIDGFRYSDLKAALRLFQLMDIKVCSDTFDFLKCEPSETLRRVE